MKSLPYLLVALPFVFSMQEILAQGNKVEAAKTNPATQERPAWVPKEPFPTIDFTTLAFARISADQKTIEILKPSVEHETRTRTYAKTSFTTETRTRTIQKNGKDEQQAYSVQVPVTETLTSDYVVSKPGNVEKLVLKIDKVHARELSGRAVSTTELTKRLSKPTKVFVTPSPNYSQFESFYDGVVKLDTIIIYCPQEEANSIEVGAPK